MNIEELITYFQGVKANGKGGYTARCPAHDDSKPSLSINRGNKGIVLKCHAGCTTDAILKKIGRKESDLFYDAPFENPPREISSKNSWPSLEAVIASYEKKYGWINEKYFYEIPGQELFFAILRWDKPSGKEIRPVSMDARGWHMEFPKGQRPLFNLPAVMEAVKKGEPIFVVEGEKCTIAAQSIGLVATTSAGGSQAAGKTDWKPLAGADICILPDNDESGRGYAQKIANILHGLNSKSLIKIVELPGLHEGGDIADWIEGFGDAAEPEVIREELFKLIGKTDAWEPGASPGAAEGTKPKGSVEGKIKEKKKAKLNFVRASEVGGKKVQWLWPDKVPLGKLTLITGRPGSAKSFLTLDMAARISKGTPWPDGTHSTMGESLVINAEDAMEDTIQPRLVSLQADLNKVHIFKNAEVEIDSEKKEFVFSSANFDLLADSLEHFPSVRLITIDPIGSFLGSGTDTYRDNEVREQLAPLKKIAEQFNVGIVLVAHNRKGSAAYADDTVLGSRAFPGYVRSSWHLLNDEQNANRRLFLAGKVTNSKPDTPGLAFEINGSLDDFSLRLNWEPEPVNMSADKYLASLRGEVGAQGSERTNRASVEVKWLAELLKNGPMESEMVMEEARKAGISTGAAKRAQRFLGLIPFKAGWQGPWSLPQVDRGFE